jgi:hydrophobic/amphiphilic exporter-1 (mainly G- bacteria), HAE1 family
MWLTSVSIRRPVFILMVVSALIVLGLNALSKMRLELNPKVDFPFVFVQTIYPGAGPEEIETQVTKKIEDVVASVNGVKTVTSSSQEGVSVVNIEFVMGTATDIAGSDVREKVAGIRNTLPVEAKEPVVQKIDMNSQPIIYYGLTGTRPSRDLRDMADNIIKPRLSKVPGVATINITGGDIREISVGVRRDRLDAYGIGINQLVALLRSNTVNFPAGRVIEGNREYSIRVVGEFSDVETIRATRLKMPNGQTVRLSDIADVQDTVAERRDVSRIDLKDSIGIVVQKTSEGNTVDVAKGVRKEVAQLEKELPAGTRFILNQDLSQNTVDQVDDVKASLFLGTFLAVMVVFLFLHNLRGTAIVAIAIPTSIIATFLVIYALGFTLNSMTMLALSLSVGILVDDSIVVLENIYRHLAKGEQPVEAAINGRGEIGLAAITITLVDVVVFLPIAFMGGIVGQFFKAYGITIAVATLFSLFMSFTLTPMLASRWYRAGDNVEAHGGVFGAFNRFYGWLDSLYRGVLRWALRYRGVVVYAGTGVLVLVFVAIIASVIGGMMAGALVPLAVVFLIAGLVMNWRYRILGLAVTGMGVAAVFLAFAIGSSAGRPLLLFRFAPDLDQGQVSVIGEMSAGTSLDKTLSVAKDIEQEVHKIPDAEGIFTSVGATQGGMGAANVGSHYFTLSIKLKEKQSLGDTVNPFAKTEGLRKRRDTEVADDIRKRVGEIPGAMIKVAAQTGFRGGGAPLQVDVLGTDIKQMTRLGEQVLQAFKEEPGTLNQDISVRLGKPEVQITVDRDKAASFGLSVSQIGQSLRTSLEGDNQSVVYREGGNEYPVNVHFVESERQNVNEVENIVVGNVPGPGNGAMQPVRLGDVASVFQAQGPTKIDRMNRQKLVSVTANIAAGFAPGNMQLNINKKLEKMSWGNSSFEWGGENKTQAEEGAYMGAALGLAIILVYMLMAALFDNMLYPLVIMLSLPQAMVGALLGLMVAGQALTIVAMIGIIMLVGLVTKNAILLVDYTNTLRERGLSRTDALLEAGPTRLRPILMTTIAMVFGMLPTALALGRGGEFRAPVATSIVGGLILSTMLTLLVIPCVYTYFDDLSRFISRTIFRRRLEPEKPADAPKEPAGAAK